MPKDKETLEPLTIRLPENVISNIQKAAQKNRRSINSEYVFRMEESLTSDRQQARLLKIIMKQNMNLQERLDTLLAAVHDLEERS